MRKSVASTDCRQGIWRARPGEREKNTINKINQEQTTWLRIVLRDAHKTQPQTHLKYVLCLPHVHVADRLGQVARPLRQSRGRPGRSRWLPIHRVRGQESVALQLLVAVVLRVGVVRCCSRRAALVLVGARCGGRCRAACACGGGRGRTHNPQRCVGRRRARGSPSTPRHVALQCGGADVGALARAETRTAATWVTFFFCDAHPPRARPPNTRTPTALGRSPPAHSTFGLVATRARSAKHEHSNHNTTKQRLARTKDKAPTTRA